MSDSTGTLRAAQPGDAYVRLGARDELDGQPVVLAGGDGSVAGRLAAAVRARLWVVAACIAASLLLALYQVRAATPLYAASTLVAPVSTKGGIGGTVDSLLPVLGLGGRIGGDDRFSEFVELIRASEVLAAVATRHGLREHYFGGWERGPDGTYLRPATMSNLPSRLLHAVGGVPYPDRLSEEMLADQVRANLKVTAVGRSELRRVSLEMSDPALAARVLADILAEADTSMRQRAYRDATLKRDAIRARLATITELPHRAALTEVLMQQEQIILTVDTGTSFSARTVDRIVASAGPVSPRVGLTFALFGAAGLLIGAAAAAVFGAARRR